MNSIKTMCKWMISTILGVSTLVSLCATIYGICFPSFFSSKGIILASGATGFLFATIIWLVAFSLISVILYAKSHNDYPQ